MKKSIFLIFLAILACLSGSIDSHAQSETMMITLHKRIYRDLRAPNDQVFQNHGLTVDEAAKINFDAADFVNEQFLDETHGLNGANFLVYDATPLAAKFFAENPEAVMTEFSQFYSQLGPREALRIAEDHKLQLVGKIKTQTQLVGDEAEDGVGSIEVPLKNSDGTYASYLIVETALDEESAVNVDLEKKASSILLTMPAVHPTTNEILTEINLYPKNVGYVRDPYFFKFGRNADGQTNPLENVVFALFLEEEGVRKYLHLNSEDDLKNQWIASNDPLNDQRIDKFVSDKNGLVNMGERFLASGIYYFEELETVKGYEIGDDCKKIKVEVPDTWEASVLINGQSLLEYQSGKIPEAAMTSQTPRVYNNRKTGNKTTSEIPVDSSKEKPLPMTGEIQTLFSLAGAGVILICSYLWQKLSEKQKRERM